MKEGCDVKGRRIALAVLVSLFVGLLAVWLYADARYEYPVYEMRETGRLLDYLDRYAGWEREAIPVYEPDNPTWVNTVRRIAPLSLFVLACAGLYMAVQVKRRSIDRLKTVNTMTLK